MKGHMEKDGFHPHTQYKGVRKSRDQQAKTQGVRLKRSQNLNLVRNIQQEKDASSVKYWFEDEDNGIVASLVDGDFPNEMEIRITIPDDRIQVTGHRSIMERMTPDQFKDKVLMHIDRHEMMNKVRKKRFVSEKDIDRMSDLEINALFKEVEKNWDGEQSESGLEGDGFTWIFTNKEDPSYTYEIDPLTEEEFEDADGNKLEEPILTNAWYWFPARNNKGIPSSPFTLSETGGYTRKDAIREFKKSFIIYDQEFSS